MPFHSRPTLIATLFLTALVPPALPQSPTPAFEVATVKLNTSGSGGSGTHYAGNRFVATNVTLKTMIQSQAFDVSAPRIVGGPKWLDSARFDIEAKIEAATIAQVMALSRDQQRLASQAMFQQLLADRFQLKTHWEERELPVFALVVAKGGPKLKPSKDPEHSGRASGPTILQGNNMSVAQLADMLTQGEADQLGKVVVDKTGIAGTYDISLKWALDPVDSVTPPAAAAAGPSLFTAIQEQLGLKLELTKAPVKVLVIDHAEMPSDN